MLYSDKDLKKVKKHHNIVLKFLMKWLNANKILLNVTKTEVILFRHANKILNYDLDLKLNGMRLFLVDSVRYLGVYLAFFELEYHINILVSKLCKAIGALSILRHYLPKSTLISCYHALFNSHATYACQVWDQLLLLLCFVLYMSCYM